MAEEKKKITISPKVREFIRNFLEGMRVKEEFVKKELKRIKEELELIPKNEIKKRYNNLLEEKRKNLIRKTEFELEKKFNDDHKAYIYPDAAKEIDKQLAELIKQYEEYMALVDTKEIEKETTSMNKKPDQSIIDTRIQMEEVNSKPEMLAPEKEIKNNFDDVKIEIVVEHFKKGLVEKKHLSEDDLLLFLQSAFDEKKPPIAKFRFINTPTKQKVWKVFHEYYKTIAGKPYGRQKEYAALLGEYFEGYDTETVSTNWSR